MPALILSGHPCSGKSTIARFIAERAQAKFGFHCDNSTTTDSTRPSVIIINEDGACPDATPHQSYASNTSEKMTRSALKAAFDRHSGTKKSSTTSKAPLILLDSLNYIKGYRYELYCISKSCSDSHGVLWIQCEDAVAQRRNEERATARRKKNPEVEEKYYVTEEMRRALVMRFEPPTEKNRWEKPLYVLDNSADLETNVEQPELEPSVELTSQIDDILEAFLHKNQPLKVGMSTKRIESANVDVLHQVDSLTQRACTLFTNAQQQQQMGSSGGRLMVPLSSSSTLSIELYRAVHTPELQKLRRRYLRWIKSHPPNPTDQGMQTEEGVMKAFLQYVETNLT